MRQIDPETPARRDPAPSRWAFRLHRWWMTPMVRRGLRTGLPVGLTMFASTWLFLQPQNQDKLGHMVWEIRRAFAERPEFMVTQMEITGAAEELSGDVREILPVDFPISSFDLDLPAMQDVVEELDAVAAAHLRVLPGGILQLNIAERVPAIVWRANGMLELLDAQGRRVAALNSRTARSDLPLIAGEGADAAVPEALELIAAAAPLEDRVRGLVRIGQRRWDVILSGDQRILLPEDDPVPALEQVIALHQAQDLLTRDLAHVDMRNPHRRTVRMKPKAIEELHRIQGIELGNILP